MQDKLVEKLIKGEEKRQREGLELIPSENYVSEDVLKANGSPARNVMVFANPAEGEEADEPKSAMTGANGVARLTGMKPGKWTVRADPIGSDTGPDAPPKNEKAVDVSAGQTSKVRFDVP